MSATQKQRYEFINRLRQHAPKATETHAKRLLRYGATYSRIQEFACNSPEIQGNWPIDAIRRAEQRYEKQLEANEAKEKRIEEKVRKLLGEIDCKPVFNGDPRGSTIKVVLPDGYTDDWGHEGLCVPTA